MQGHTQVIFIVLGIGLAIAFASLVGELGGKLLKCIKALWSICRSQFLFWKSKLKFKQTFVNILGRCAIRLYYVRNDSKKVRVINVRRNFY